MDSLSRMSIQYKFIMPWILPVIGLIYAFIAMPNEQAGSALIVLSLLCAAGLIASWMQAHKFLTVLVLATRSANATANGDYSYEPNTKGKDELAKLIYTMVNLRNSVKSAISGGLDSDVERQVAKENSEKVVAINKVQAVIEFEMDGTIITANDKFLDAMGYTLNEVQGKHHSIFVDSQYK
ncbi:MAG: methyl-accepting chemotaxis protein, partial [Bermanella sp.]